MVLHYIARIESFTFFFENEAILELMVGFFGFGLCYFFVAMLFTQCLDDPYTLYFVYNLVLSILYPLLRTEKMDGSGSTDYYFGFNSMFPSIHNFYISYLIALLSALLYIAVEQWRHSMTCRIKTRYIYDCACFKGRKRLYQSAAALL